MGFESSSAVLADHHVAEERLDDGGHVFRIGKLVDKRLAHRARAGGNRAARARVGAHDHRYVARQTARMEGIGNLRST